MSFESHIFCPYICAHNAHKLRQRHCNSFALPHAVVLLQILAFCDVAGAYTECVKVLSKLCNDAVTACSCVL